jgi:uncharacterized protein (DUF1697 family)
VARYAAFLRGMNVGGHRLSNAELRAHFEALGFDQVATFRASGNVVFSEERAELSAAQLREVEERVERGLAAALGYAVPTFVRDAREMRAIAAHAPFTEAELGVLAGKQQVALLASAPSAGAREQVLALATAEDLLAFGRRELYWQPAGRISDSALELKLIERVLGAMTMRTRATIELIAGAHFAVDQPPR